MVKNRWVLRDKKGTEITEHPLLDLLRLPYSGPMMSGCEPGFVIKESHVDGGGTRVIDRAKLLEVSLCPERRD